MADLTSIGLQVLEEKAAKKREVGSSLFQRMIMDPWAMAGIGFDSMTPAVAKERMDSLFEATRQIQWTANKRGSFYKEGASDEEIQQEVKRFDSKVVRMDAGEGTFLERDLEFLDPVNYPVIYQDKTKWRRLFPVRELNAPGMDTYRYEMQDFTGEAEFGSDGATDAPDSDPKSNFYTKPVHKIHRAYSYTIDEIRAHIYGNRPLETRKIENALRAFEQKMHKIIWNGDSAHDIEGVIGHTGVTSVEAPLRNAVRTWAAKIAAAGGGYDVVLDLIDFVKAANIASQDNFWNAENPGMIAVPLDQYHLISGSTINTANASNISIREYAIKYIPGLMDIVSVIDLDGAGTGPSDLALGWVPRGELMEIVTTMPITWQPMERRGQKFTFYGDMKFVGPVVRYTDSMYEMYGI